MLDQVQVIEFLDLFDRYFDAHTGSSNRITNSGTAENVLIACMMCGFAPISKL